MSQTTRLLSRGELDVRVMATARLDVVDGPDRGRRAELDKPLYRVGTHESNDLQLSDETVSKHHLEIAITPSGYRILDLGSSNATFINDVQVSDVIVRDGVTLQLGNTKLQLRPDGNETELAAAQTTSFGLLVGRSPVMREMFAELARVAPSELSVLLEGETGVGKEVVAESIHQASPRKDGPFVVVDCAALVGDLMESELFGHMRGAFTGADRDKEGLLESADGGTLFLDEIGELPLSLQSKLLGALERRQIRRVGSNTPKSIDVRVIAATNRNLGRAVNDGSFRADLFYRLAVLRLRIPALRERLEDIPLLVEHFLDGRAQLSAVAIARLQAQPWPGNVRELRNAVDRATLLGAPPAPAPDASAPSRPPSAPLFTARADAVTGFERDYFQQLLALVADNMSQACRLSALDRRYLYRILKRLGLRQRQ